MKAEDLDKHSAQEVFDVIARHLLTQKAKCWGPNSCVYKNDAGMMCAAGVLVGHLDLPLDVQTKPWDSLCVYLGLPTDHSGLIMRLQRVHDGWSVDRWGAELADVAYDFDLTTSVLTEGVVECLP
jgi:hypothetical protein